MKILFLMTLFSFPMFASDDLSRHHRPDPSEFLSVGTQEACQPKGVNSIFLEDFRTVKDLLELDEDIYRQEGTASEPSYMPRYNERGYPIEDDSYKPQVNNEVQAHNSSQDCEFEYPWE